MGLRLDPVPIWSIFLGYLIHAVLSTCLYLVCAPQIFLAAVSRFFAPLGISGMVVHGTKTEWNSVMYTLIVSCLLGAAIYGMFGSSKLPKCDKLEKNENNNI